MRHKKNDGTLYLMAERCGWMVGSKDTFSVQHKYADIKSQKISPEGKAKIQLQLVTHDNISTTFHFVNPDGQAVQVCRCGDCNSGRSRCDGRFRCSRYESATP